MKIAIMQPYAFPYLGYFQLIKSVDKFIVLDDVCFIKQGWINRNRVAGRGGVQFFVLPVVKPRTGQLISQMQFHQVEFYRSKFLKTIDQLYIKAPYYGEVRTMIENTISLDDTDLTRNLLHMMRMVCDYLSIRTEIIRSSDNHANLDGKGQERLIKICLAENADTYINAGGGESLYDKLVFEKAGIQLFFLQHIPTTYLHFLQPCPERLSIIDLLMFNDKEQLDGMLKSYELC